MSKFLEKLKREINSIKFSGNVYRTLNLVNSLGENARRMLEIGIVKDELVKLGFEFNKYDNTLGSVYPLATVDFSKLDSVKLTTSDAYDFEYTSPTWSEDLLNKVKEIVND